MSAKLCGRCPGGVVVALHQALSDFAFEASGKTDQAARVLRQKFLADARLVVKTVQRGFRGDLDQVAVALFVFGQHQQVIVSVALGRRALDVVVVFFADVEFAADDRLHAVLVGGVDKMHRAEDVAVIGHGDGGHAQFLDALAQLFYVTGAVEQGIVGVEMQVDELRHECS